MGGVYSVVHINAKTERSEALWLAAALIHVGRHWLPFISAAFLVLRCSSQ